MGGAGDLESVVSAKRDVHEREANAKMTHGGDTRSEEIARELGQTRRSEGTDDMEAATAEVLELATSRMVQG